jgi:hypothetical protein
LPSGDLHDGGRPKGSPVWRVVGGSALIIVRLARRELVWGGNGRLLRDQGPRRANARVRLFRGGAGSRQRYRLLRRRIGLGIDRGMCWGGGPKQKRESQNPRQTDEKRKGESRPHPNTLNERHEFAHAAQEETPLPSSGSRSPTAGTDSIEIPAEFGTGGQSACPSP